MRIKPNLKTILKENTFFQPVNTLLFGLFLSVIFLYFLSESYQYYPKLIGVGFALVAALMALYFAKFFILGALLGIMTFTLNVNPAYKVSFTNCEFSGVITKSSYKKGYIYIKANNIFCRNKELPNQTIVFWDNDILFKNELGSKFQFKSNLSPVKSRLNKNEFSYEKYLNKQGILLSASSLETIEKIKYFNFFLILKKKLQKQIYNNLSKSNSSTIVAIITGDRTKLNSHQKDIIQKTGVSHILAISGLHLAIIGFWAWFFMQALWSFFPKFHKILSPIQAGAIFAFIIISFYVFLTGFQVPAKRAWIMFFVLILSWLRLKSLQNSLSLAAILVILFDPLATFSIGFYLSFLATFIVINSVSRQNLDKPRKLGNISKIIQIQIYIPLVLLPITWYYFGYISVVVFISNLVIIPLIAFWLLPIAVLANLFEFVVPFIAKYFWIICDFFTSVLWSNLNFFFSFDTTIAPNFQPSLAAVIIATIALLAFILKKRFIYLLFCLGLFIPNLNTDNPSLLIADSKQTSLLIHNGDQAIIINPGRRYKYRNDAKKWLKYLTQNNLDLIAVVLEDNGISKISATKTLIDNYKKAKIIRLSKFDLPFNSSYCQSIKLPNMELKSNLSQKNNCQTNIIWFKEQISLFNKKLDNEKSSIQGKSKIIWQNRTLDANKLGMITIEYKDNSFNVSYLRNILYHN